MSGVIQVPTALLGQEIAIRTYRPSDVCPYFEAARESMEAVSPHLPWLHPDYVLADTRSWITEQVPRLWAQQREYHFVITDTETALIGGCGLDALDWTDRTANIGYWVRTSRTGQGIATAAAKLLLRFGFERLALKRIDLVTSVENVPSVRVARKLNPSVTRRVISERDGSETVLFSVFPSNTTCN